MPRKLLRPMISENYTQNLGQIATLSGLLGGFMIAVVFQLLAMPERKRGSFLTILMALISSSCFVVCGFLCTFIIMGANSLMMNQVQQIPSNYNLVFAVAILAFAIGSASFSATVAFAGWLHSKLLGMASVIIATVIAIGMGMGVWVLISSWYEAVPKP